MKYICVDAGGTKTRFVLYSEDGEILDQEVLPSCHFMKVGFPGMAEILHQGYRALKERSSLSENELILSLGLAGYGREEKIRRSIEEALSDTFRTQRYVLHNDIETAMEGAFSGRDGIMLIAGTGSIAFCRHQGKMRRSGGWGYLFGDEGSAYWLGRKMLEVFSKEEDGRLEKSFIYDLLMEHLNLQHGYDLITYVRETLGNRREDIAKLALILHKAASEGDKRALSLYDEAARELAALVIAAAKETNDNIDVAYFGGVFEAGKLILDPLRANLSERFSLKKPEGSPEYGAYLLAKKIEQ